MTRIRVEVAPDRKAGGWKLGTPEDVFRYPTQREAIAAAVEWCQMEARAGRLLTLKIKRRNGTIRDERTYPRSSDPRRSRG